MDQLRVLIGVTRISLHKSLQVSWNTTINSATFGLPTSTNGMRTLQTTLRLRF